MAQCPFHPILWSYQLASFFWVYFVEWVYCFEFVDWVEWVELVVCVEWVGWVGSVSYEEMNLTKDWIVLIAVVAV